MGSLQKQLADYRCQKHLAHYNILLIGEKGAGKSSLLSTFHRALRAPPPDAHDHPAAADGGDHEGAAAAAAAAVAMKAPIAPIGNKKTEAFTRRKTGYALNRAGSIWGHDTRGLETFLQSELEQVRAIRDGKVADNVEIVAKQSWTVWDYMYSMVSRNPASILDPNCLHQGAVTLQDLPHAVIFVFAANQRAPPKDVANFVNLFTEYGYDPLFAVTKIDCHGGQQGDLYAATHLYDSKKEQLIQMFDLEYDRVKPIQNYTQWEKREVSIDNLAIDLLNKAVKTADQFVSQYDSHKTAYTSGSVWSSISNCTIS